MKRLLIIVMLLFIPIVSADTLQSSTFRTTVAVYTGDSVLQSATFRTTPNIVSFGGISDSSTFRTVINKFVVKPLQIVVAVTSCTYTSGNWNVDCSDNCRISSEVDVGGNDVVFTSTGNFITLADIINVGKVIISTSASCEIVCDGGCFK